MYGVLNVMTGVRSVEALWASVAGAVPVPAARGPTDVSVSGETYAVSTHQTLESFWVASGNYKDVQYRTEDRSEGTAVKQ